MNSLNNSIVDKNKPKSKFKRRYVTRALWVITLITSTLILILLDNILCVYIISSIICIVGLTNILMIYIYPKFFTPLAYVIVIISYLIAFIKLVIIPLDISVSISHIEKSEYIHSVIDIIWNIAYWISVLFNTFIIRFLMTYWNQGHPSFKQKIKNTFKTLFYQILIMGSLFISVIIFLIIKYGAKKLIFLSLSLLQIINVFYCLTVVILFSGYGLVELPFNFFFITDTKNRLKLLLSNLSPFREDLITAANKLIINKAVLIDACSKVINSYNKTKSNDELYKFARDIIISTDCYNVDYNDLIIYKKIEPINKIKNDIDINNLAQMYMVTKADFYYYCKKEAALLRLYLKICNICYKFTEIEENDFPLETYINENISDDYRLEANITLDTNYYNNDNSNCKIKSEVEMKKNKTLSKKQNNIEYLIPKNYNIIIIIFTKMVSIILMIMSILVLIFQINLFFIQKINLFVIIVKSLDNFYFNFIVVILYFTYLFICSFYSISKFRIMESYVLVPHHTNKYDMIYNSAICNTLIIGIAYNTLYFFSTYYDNSDIDKSKSVANLFNGMKQFNFIYDSYTYFFPCLLLIVILLSILKKINILKINSKRLENFEIEIITADQITFDKKAFDVLLYIEKTFYKD